MHVFSNTFIFRPNQDRADRNGWAAGSIPAGGPKKLHFTQLCCMLRRNKCIKFTLEMSIYKTVQHSFNRVRFPK